MAGHDGHEWIELYRAALLAPDEELVRERIAIAERAIRAFASELEGSGGEQPAQLKNLYEALSALDALRRLYS
jgi:hypothetical protein